MGIHDVIRRRFHIHNGDLSPYVGWGSPTTREDIGKLFGELGYKLGAEVGVAHGTNAAMFFKHVPGLKLICVDPWSAFGKNTDEHMENVYRNARKNLDGKDVVWKRTPSLDGAKEVEDGSLDFVYIDGLHDFDSVMVDVITWTKKVRKGGIVSGHDFVYAPREGVVAAVTAYTKAHNVHHLYLTKERNECNSWFFVKEKNWR